MPTECNINARGKAARLVCGTVVVIASAALMWAWASGSGGAIPWAVCVALMLTGGFMIYEGATGWCAVRAMGFKTPI